MQNEPSVPVPDNTGDNVVFQDKPKKTLGVILGMVFLVLLAVGGIGFGVWAMMDGDTQKEQLNEQIDALKALIDDLEKQNEEKSDNANDDDNSDSNNSVNEANENLTYEGSYIDIEEWGFRISIPNELVITNHEYKDYTSENYSSFCVWGYSRKGDQASPSFAKKNEPFVCIERHPEDTYYYGHTVFTEEGYDYLFNSAQSYLSDEGDEDGKKWEDETRVLMSRTLGQKENYSKKQ